MPPPEVADSLRERRPIAQGALESRPAPIDEIVADVREPIAIVARTFELIVVCHRGVLRDVDGGAGDRRLRRIHALGELFDRVPVAIARIESHRGVETGWILAQHRFRDAQGLDEVGPAKARYRAKARDAVRHHELCQRQPSRRTLDGRLHTHGVLCDPLLEPEQGGEVGARDANLLEESREERRCHLRRMCDKVRELTPQASVITRGGTKTANLCVGSPGVHHVALRAKRHTSHVFEQSHAEHHRPCPELTQRQRRDALILTYHELHVLLVELALRVCDQLDRDAVDFRIPLIRPGLELRQLVIVALRHACTNFASVLDDDEKRIEEPCTRRRDVDPARTRIK